MAKANKPLTMAQKNAIANYVRRNAGAQPGKNAPTIAEAKSLFGKTYRQHLSGTQIMKDPAEFSAFLKRRTGATGTLDEQLAKLLPAEAWRGLQQFVGNQEGVYGPMGRNMPAYLRNTGFATDPNMLLRIIGEGRGAATRGEGKKLMDIWQQREKDIPDWVTKTFAASEKTPYESIMARPEHGLDWSLELFKSPGFNLTDPTQPLFGPKENPASLSQLTGGGAGELGFLRTLSPEEVMNTLLPQYNASFRQAAGAPSAGGMTFGSYDPSTGQVGGTMRNTDLYRRWSAYGMPGDPSENAWVTETTGRYNPLTGQWVVRPGYGQRQLDRISGMQPGYFHDPATYRDMVISMLGRTGAAGYLGDPSIYFSGPFAQFAPGSLDPAAYARMMAVMQSTPTPRFGY